MSFFSAEHISAGYTNHKILRDISFNVEPGSLTGILGINGSGKTTLLKSICNVLPHEGTCRLDGQILENLSHRQRARLCAYIPQRSGISIDISALDVVLMGFNPHLKLLDQPDRAMKKAAEEALCNVGLADKIQENYLHLSEGEKQLCIIARILVSGARLLLLDEPESALDFRLRHRTLNLLKCDLKQRERSAVVTLHDSTLALNCCDELLLLSGGSLAGKLQPRADSIEKMEAMLSEIYGSVSLHRCTGRNGLESLVMLKEEDQ